MLIHSDLGCSVASVNFLEAVQYITSIGSYESLKKKKKHWTVHVYIISLYCFQLLSICEKKNKLVVNGWLPLLF